MAVNDENSGKQVQYTSLNQLDSVDSEIINAGDTLCGCGPCKPTFMQRLARPMVFTGHAGLLIAVNFCALTYFSGILTTLERQFQLSSSEVAALSIINDASLLCVVLFVTHFGQTSHRPRWIGAGAMLVAVALFIISLPHFLSDPIDLRSLLAGGTGRASGGKSRRMTGVCSFDSSDDGQNTTAGQLCQKESSDDDGMGLVKWVVVGQVIWGCGAAPLFPLTLSYIDDAVQRHKFTSYTGKLLSYYLITVYMCTYRVVKFKRKQKQLNFLKVRLFVLFC